MKYKDHSGNEFEADVIRQCPNPLESGSFEYWTAEQKQGYLTALRSLKEHLS